MHCLLKVYMNEKMNKFGWGAVAVRGFIPPEIFMEFQALGILPIACDMRSSEHLTYTPAPDIVHESAGHNPIIINEEYAHYLKEYGNGLGPRGSEKILNSMIPSWWIDILPKSEQKEIKETLIEINSKSNAYAKRREGKN